MWGGNKMGSSMTPSYCWETGGITVQWRSIGSLGGSTYTVQLYQCQIC